MRKCLRTQHVLTCQIRALVLANSSSWLLGTPFYESPTWSLAQRRHLHTTARICCSTARPSFANSSDAVPAAEATDTADVSAEPTEHTARRHVSTDDALLSHCRLLGHIATSREPLAKKQRRAAGVVRKLEQDYTDWLMEPAGCTPAQAATRRWMLLESLARCTPFLTRRDRRGSTDGFAVKDDEKSWSGASPFFSPDTHDALCLCLQTCVPDATATHDRPLALLEAAVQLELADGDALQTLSRRLTSKAWCQAATPHDLAQALKWISLAVKRCKCQLPPMDHLLCLLPTADLSPRDALEVLSALVRLRDVRATEVSKVVQRRAAKDVPQYSVKDVVYALEAVAILDVCDTSFAAATLRRCEILVPSMSAAQIGDVCKYVALLNGQRQRNEVADTCPRELRRVLPALVERTELLLGEFRLRDARCVLRCFQQHKVRHSVVFSQLTHFSAHSD